MIGRLRLGLGLGLELVLRLSDHSLQVIRRRTLQNLHGFSVRDYQLDHELSTSHDQSWIDLEDRPTVCDCMLAFVGFQPALKNGTLTYNLVSTQRSNQCRSEGAFVLIVW